MKMRKNLLAMLLAVVMIAAVVFIAAPNAQAATVTASKDDDVITVAAGDTVDLAGKKNVTINVTNGGAIYLVDSANLEKLDGTKSGSAILGKNVTLAESWVQHTDGFKYLAVKDDNTYSAHPFNLTIDKIGVNTHFPAIAIRAVFIADDTVAQLIHAGSFGLHNHTVDPNTDEVEFTPYTRKTFVTNEGIINGIEAYFFLEGSLSSTVLENNISNTFSAYIKIDGYETIDSKTQAKIAPQQILTDLNKKAGRFSLDQKIKMQTMIEVPRVTEDSEGNLITLDYSYLKEYCANFIPTNSSLSFENANIRTEFSTEKQVWKQNGIIFTNEKAKSTNAVADYSNPVRLYQDSVVTIAASGMTQVIIESDGTAKYKTALEDSLTDAGFTYTNSENTYTITLSNATDSITFSVKTGQIRFESIEVTAYPPCLHKNKTEPTCENEGKCNDCLAVIEKLPHTYTGATCTIPGKCSCGEEGPTDATKHNWQTATCTTPKTCADCGAKEGAALGHTYVNGVCGNCGAAETTQPKTITVSKTIADLITANGWTSSTTKQSFKLDDVVSVKIDGGSNSGKAYNGDHIRIYATDSPAGSMTITLADGYELVSIKISTKTGGTYAFLYVDGSTTDISNVLTSVSGNSVLLNSVKNGSDGKQVQVTGIEVTYLAGTTGGDTPDTPETPVCESEKCATCQGCLNSECTICKAVCPGHASGNPTWQKATSIKVGDVVTLVCETKKMELSGISTTSTKYGTGVAYTTVAGKYTLTVVAGSTSGTYAFKTANGQYLYWTSDNSLATNSTLNANTSWNVSFSSGNVVITNAKDSSRKIGWNASSPRFACYTTSQTAIQLYVYE